MAFDSETGKQLWRSETGHSFQESRGHGPRGTPTVDGDRLYALAADGMLVCLETATGKRVWGFNIVDRFHGRVLHWGISESPLVDGDRVIVTPGGTGAAVVALDKTNGKVYYGRLRTIRPGILRRWLSSRQCSRKLVVFTGEAAIGLDFNSGRLLWRYEKVANQYRQPSPRLSSMCLIFFFRRITAPAARC